MSARTGSDDEILWPFGQGVIHESMKTILHDTRGFPMVKLYSTARKRWTGAGFAQDDAICTSFPQFSLLIFMHIQLHRTGWTSPYGERKQANLDAII